jgi:acyl-CoA thioesterase-1
MQPDVTRRRSIAALAAAAALALAPIPASAAEPPVILVVGDSISAAYGLPTGVGWTDLLQKRLDARKLGYRVVNASISGDTTAGGRSRLPALLTRHKPAIVVIELGGNDGLRGGSIASTRDNLTAMTKAAKAAGARPMLIGMRLPPNYGPAYTRQFENSFPKSPRPRERRSCRSSSRASARTRPRSSPTASIRPRRRRRSCSTTRGRRSSAC